jgi:ferredoxin
MMCGASLVAVESAVQHRGYKIFEEITDGMIRFMERQGYKTPLEITGLANPHIEDMETFMSDFMMATVPAQSIGIHIDREKCNKCGICASCIYGAMTIINGHPEINVEVCERCGACMTICPKEAIFTTAA